MTNSTAYDEAIDDARAFFSIFENPTSDDYAFLERAQQTAAEMFGEARGWKLSKRGFFGLETLSRGGVRERKGETSLIQPADVFDHRYYYRNGQYAAAIVSFPYKTNKPELKARAENVAAQFSLRLESLDEPGWYRPGSTAFFIWTPRHEREWSKRSG